VCPSQPAPDPGSRGAPSFQATCWTPERSELKAWLYRNAPSLAELYEGATLLIFELPIPGHLRFVAHAVREIRNRLPFVISGSRSGGNLNYKDRMDQITKRWKNAGFLTDGKITGLPADSSSLEPKQADILLPRGVVRLLAELIAEHEETREKPIETATRLFIGVAPENDKFRNAIRPAITQWLDVTDWFMKKTHDPATGVSIEAGVDKAELRTKFELFETILLAIVRDFSTFFKTTDALDAILEDANS